MAFWQWAGGRPSQELLVRIHTYFVRTIQEQKAPLHGDGSRLRQHVSHRDLLPMYPRAFFLSAGYSPAVSKLLCRAAHLGRRQAVPRSVVPEMTDRHRCSLVMAHPTLREEALSPAPGVFSAGQGNEATESLARAMDSSGLLSPRKHHQGDDDGRLGRSTLGLANVQ